MRRQLLHLTVILALVFQSCGKPLEETKLEKFDLTITSPKLDAAPEFTEMKTSEGDTELSNYDFNMGGHARVSITEITESVYPTDVEMLKKAITGSESFVELIETKKLANGAFGIIYKMKGSDEKSIIKNYRFYFKKGTRFFKMEPVFNNDLTDLDKQVAAFESLK